MTQKTKSATRPRPNRPGRKPRVAIVGAGRLGTALGYALKNAGYVIHAVISEREASARRAAKRFGAATRWMTAANLNQKTSDALNLFDEIDLIIIATPDDKIKQVSEQLAA